MMALAASPMAGHRMQHESGPTWCRDCGTFDYACSGECPAAGAGDFDSATDRGAKRIAEELLDTFGLKEQGQGELELQP
jgi:hypothetical protein